MPFSNRRDAAKTRTCRSERKVFETDAQSFERALHPILNEWKISTGRRLVVIGNEVRSTTLRPIRKALSNHRESTAGSENDPLVEPEQLMHRAQRWDCGI